MIRRADHGDVSRIQAVLNRPENWDKLEAYADEAVRAAIDGAQTTVFVWEEDRQWQGFCWLQRAADSVKVEEFGVNMPGAGIGSRFFSAVLEDLDLHEKAKSVWLAVAADNTAAIRFYERFDFVPTGLREAAWKRRKGPVADALIMTRMK